MPTNAGEHCRHLVVRQLLDELTKLVPGSAHEPRISRPSTPMASYALAALMRNG
jgi:hypothetical protein